MKYSIGDRLVVDGVEAEIAYVNQGRAWLVPAISTDFEDTFKGKELVVGLVFAILEKNGTLADGTRAYSVVGSQCQAV